MATPSAVVSTMGVLLELQALESLPCGCVAAAYVTRPLDLAMVSVEAKGPYCVFADHSTDRVLQLGTPSELMLDESGGGELDEARGEAC